MCSCTLYGSPGYVPNMGHWALEGANCVRKTESGNPVTHLGDTEMQHSGHLLKYIF